MMMLSITFWLSDVHIHSDTASFSSKSFYDSDLLRLAKGLVIFSLVTITIVIVNNIVSIVAIINGSYRILKVVSINRCKLVREIIKIALWETNLQKVHPVVVIILSKRLNGNYR